MDGSCKFSRGNIYMQIIASVCWPLMHEMHKHANSCTYANIRNKQENTQEEMWKYTHMSTLEVMRWCMRALKPLSRASFTSFSTGLSAQECVSMCVCVSLFSCVALLLSVRVRYDWSTQSWCVWLYQIKQGKEEGWKLLLTVLSFVFEIRGKENRLCLYVLL